jgi:hypothetical protein
MNFEIAPKSTEIQANWDDTRLYCFLINIDGKIGWRLPTIEELSKIYTIRDYGFTRDSYWSSSVDNHSKKYWVLNCNVGYQYVGYGIHSVRLVRDLKDD